MTPLRCQFNKNLSEFFSGCQLQLDEYTKESDEQACVIGRLLGGIYEVFTQINYSCYEGRRENQHGTLHATVDRGNVNEYVLKEEDDELLFKQLVHSNSDNTINNLFFINFSFLDFKEIKKRFPSFCFRFLLRDILIKNLIHELSY